jgi:hypothetical protein
MSVSGQITDQEKTLRKLSTDSIEGWNVGGLFGVNLAQASLTNWAAGGQNSLAVNSLFSLFVNYKRGTSAWDNLLDMGYGILKQGKNSDYIKTNDKFDFTSKYGQKMVGNVYLAALINFRTQFAEGFDYARDTARISDFLAPAYFLAALGLDYKPNNYFSAFFAPVTLKLTIVNSKRLSDAGAYGVTPGDRSRSEFGGYVRLVYTRSNFASEFLKNVSFITKVDLFSDYAHNPQNIDVNWETVIAFNINKYLAVNFNTQLLYDDDINISVDSNGDGVVDKSGPRTQFKEILGVGLALKF